MISADSRKKLQVEVKIRHHSIMADVTAQESGDDLGPNPHEILEAALVSCKIMTVKLYAKHKQWPLDSVSAKIAITSEDANATIIKCFMTFEGDLTDEQKQRLIAIADKCPVHRLLTGVVQISSEQNE
jgi:putative redox protein